MVFVFGFVYVMDYVYRLVYVEPALYPRDEAYLIMMNKLFDFLLHSVCQYFIEDFCIDVHHGLALCLSVIGFLKPEKFSFLVLSLPDFGIRMMLVS